MQRIINFRSIFLLFIVSLITIFFAVKINVSYFYLLGFIIPLSWIIIVIIKRKYILAIVSFLLLILFSVYPYLFIKNYSAKSLENTELVVSGKVCDIHKVNSNFSYLTLEKVTFLTENNKSINSNGNVSVAFSFENENCINIGYKIVFTAQIEATKILINGKIDTIYLKNDIRYAVSNVVSETKATIISGDMPLNEKFKEYNKTLLINNLGEEKGNLALGVLYGDRSGVNDNLLDVFKTSGVMHIFAVSGLHIGLIVAILYFILKKLKLNNLSVFFITAICLLIYCYLCSFSSPVVRATIMSLVVLFAKIVKRKNDTLTTLSFSGLILLTINPMYVFDGGFQMTFAAVFGILLFTPFFNKLKIKPLFLKKIISLIATSIATQLTMLPILAEFYGYYATWSILGNLVTLPIFSIFYTLLFVVNLFALIFPFMQFLYFLPNSILTVLIALNSCVASLPYGIIKSYSWGISSSILYYLLLFSLSRFLLLDLKIKFIAVVILMTISVSCIYLNVKPFKSTENGFYFYPNCDKGFSNLLVTDDNKCYLINPIITQHNIKLIKSELQTKKIRNISGIIFTEFYEFEALLLKPLLDEYSSIIYLPTNHKAIENLKQINCCVVVVSEDNPVNLYNFDLEYMYYQNYFVGAFINFGYYKYFEFNFSVANNIYLKDFILDTLNFNLDCVKINNSNLAIFADCFKTNNYITSNNNNFYQKVAMSN